MTPQLRAGADAADVARTDEGSRHVQVRQDGRDETGAVDPSTIGERITRLRTDKSLSLGELANRAAVSKSYLSTVERGTGSRPGASVLHRIAQALGVTLADLIGRQIVADPVLVIPPALRDLARERRLPPRDVEMLAGISFRGDAPQTKERWIFIYEAIKNSAAMDSNRH